MARPATEVQHGTGDDRIVLADRPHQGLGREERRVREAVEEVGAFGIGAEDLERLPIGGLGVADQQRPEPFSAFAVQPQQREERRLMLVRLERVQGIAGGLVGDQHRDAGDDRKSTALAAEHSQLDHDAAAYESVVLHEGQTGAAERAAEQVEQRLVHGCQVRAGSALTALTGAANQSMKASPRAPTSARR